MLPNANAGFFSLRLAIDVADEGLFSADPVCLGVAAWVFFVPAAASFDCDLPVAVGVAGWLTFDAAENVKDGFPVFPSEGWLDAARGDDGVFIAAPNEKEGFLVAGVPAASPVLVTGAGEALAPLVAGAFPPVNPAAEDVRSGESHGEAAENANLATGLLAADFGVGVAGEKEKVLAGTFCATATAGEDGGGADEDAAREEKGSGRALDANPGFKPTGCPASSSSSSSSLAARAARASRACQKVGGNGNGVSAQARTSTDRL